MLEPYDICPVTPDAAEDDVRCHVDCLVETYVDRMPPEFAAQHRSDLPEQAPVSSAPFQLHHLDTRRRTYGTGLGRRLLDLAVGDRPTNLWILDGNLTGGPVLPPGGVPARRRHPDLRSELVPPAHAPTGPSGVERGARTRLSEGAARMETCPGSYRLSQTPG